LLLLVVVTTSEEGEKPGVRVLLVGNNPIVRELLRVECAARPHLKIVGEVNGRRATEESRRIGPDVVVLDLDSEGADALEMMRKLKGEGSPTRFLVLSSRTDPEVALEAIRAGVDGYLDGTASSEEIAPALEAVADGEPAFSLAIQQGAAAGLARLAERSRRRVEWRARLTPREWEVLGLVAMGRSTRAMASELYLSERTVRTHLGDLYRKLGVSGRVALLRRGLDLGLIELRPSAGTTAASDYTDNS